MATSGTIKVKIDNLLHEIFIRGLTSRRGQTLVEYALLLVLIAMVVIFMLSGLGSSLTNKYSTISSAMPS
jgi:Flp pilus assembly pilin Flp